MAEQYSQQQRRANVAPNQRAAATYAAQARRASAQGDLRAVRILCRKSLEANIFCAEAWELLYQLDGNGRSLDEFQDAFAAKYFPGKLPSLAIARRAGPATEEPIPPATEPPARDRPKS